MIQKKKFVKTFRNTKTVQLVLLLLLEATYVLVLTLNPALGTKLFEDRTLFILCTLSWILALFNLIWLLYDFYKLRTFAEESHALNRAAFLDHLTGIPNRHGLDVVFECSGVPQMVNLATDLIRMGGKVGVVGIYSGKAELDLSTLVRSQKSLICTFGGMTPYGRTLEWAKGHPELMQKAEKIVTHKNQLEDFEEMLRRSRAHESIKEVFVFD